MTFGYLYDFRNPAQWHRPWADLYAERLEFAAWTESLGFEAAWVPEHHVDHDGYVSSPLTVLAALAARTKKLKLGSGVALTPFYHPVRFAEETTLVDILSNGRLEMGVALGYRQRETDAYGVDFKSRGSRMSEFLEIVRRLWSGETFSFEGKHFTLKDAFITPRPLTGHIPLLIGAFSDTALERAAKYGDGYFGNIEVYARYCEKLRALGKDPAAARIYMQSIFIVVAQDPEKALEELAPYYHYVNNGYGRWLNEDQYESRINVQAPPKEMPLEAFKASGLLQILTPDQAIDLFRDMRAQAPVEHVMLMVPPGLSPSKFAPYAETFANKVIPALR